MHLSSAYQSLAAKGGDPASVPSVTINTSGALGGFTVSVAPIITAFFSSLSPACGLDNRRQMSEFVGNLPDSSGSQAKAGEVVQKVKLACNVLSSWAPSVRVVTDVVANLCSSLSLAQDFGQVLEAGKENKRQSTPASISVPAGAALALVALDNLGGAAAVPAPGERGSPQNPIQVLNSETLGKIGQDGDYPADAYYLQNVSFPHEIEKPGAIFNGHYDGGCHTISGLKTCLFSDIGRHGVVRNLRLYNATIIDSLPAQGVLACTMAPFSTARNILVEQAEVRNRANGNNRRDLAATGSLVGHQHHSARITDVDLRYCRVGNTGSYAAAGAVGGRIEGKLERVNAGYCLVYTRGEWSPAGIGAGQLKGQIKDLAVTDSRAETDLSSAYSGIGAGWVMPDGTIERMSVKRCDAEAKGRLGSAGIGGGMIIGDLKQLTVVDSEVKTTNTKGFAGIGGGRVGDDDYGDLGRVSDMTFVQSKVSTEGERAHAGLIAGWLHGKAREIASVDCEVYAEGVDAKTGIGVGINDGDIQDFTSVRDRAQNRDNSSHLLAGVDWGTRKGISFLDPMLNGQEKVNPLPTPSDLCANADPRLVDSDCIERQPAVFEWRCASAGLGRLNGSVWLPIEVNDEKTINSIGRSARYPSDAHYVQTSNLDGARLDGNSSLVFDGHYDGRNHIIRNQHTCLFDNLRGTLKNLRLADARITAYGKDAAVVACKMDDGGIIEDIWIGNSSVTTRGPALAGLVSARRTGEFNRVSRVEIDNSRVETQADDALAGAVAGQCHGVTERVDVHRTRVKTCGASAHGALAGGTVQGKLESFAAICSQVETGGPGAMAGIGAGVLLADGQIKGLTVVNGSVCTAGDGSDAGVGAGQIQSSGRLRETSALYTRVHTAGRGASAGVGAGRVVEGGTVARVTGFKSEVITTGAESDAGFGVGTIDTTGYRLLGLKSAYNVIRTKGDSSRTSITGNLAAGGSVFVADSDTIDTFVNSVFKNNSVPQDTRNSFCGYADRRLVAPDCHINRTALPGNCAPMQCASSPNLTTPPTGGEPAEITAKPPVPTSSPGNQSLVPVSLQPLTVAPVPLAGLSNAAVAGIVVASVSSMICAGIVAYCCYRSRYQTYKPNKEEPVEEWSL